MQRFFPAPLRGAIALTAYTFTLLLGLMVAFGLALLYFLLPFSGMRRKILHWSESKLPRGWSAVNRRIRRHISGVTIDYIFPPAFTPSPHYLVVANHQSWTDILLLFEALSDHIPMLKFFIKKQLRWVPLIGQGCWLYGFPFLSRHSKAQLARHPEWKGKDFAETRKACERFKTRPGSLVIFAEGTRFTAAKHSRQQSPYSHLLKPRAGGIALALQCMQAQLRILLDVTLVYPSRQPTFWQYCCGFTRNIAIRVRELPLTPDLYGDYENNETYRTHFQQFLNKLWEEKQQYLTTYPAKNFIDKKWQKHSQPAVSPWQFKYWPVWLGTGVLWLLVQLPWRWQLTIGKTLGLLALRIAKRERRIATINIQRCFPQLSAAERQRLLRASFQEMGISGLETAFGWWAPLRRLRRLIHIEGLEHVERALQQHKGVLLCTPHMASLHIAGRLATLHRAFAAMYFPPKNVVLRLISQRAMSRYYARAIVRNDARGLLKALQANLPVFYTPDTDAGLKNSLFAPFFGISTATVTATARFAQISGCAVIFTEYWRRADGKGYEIRFSPPLEGYPGDDPYADALRMNQRLEQAIMAHPEQYLWQYKRFKTRPQGEKSFY